MCLLWLWNVAARNVQESCSISWSNYFLRRPSLQERAMRHARSQTKMFCFFFWLERTICWKFFSWKDAKDSTVPSAETCMQAAEFPVVSAGWKLTPTKSPKCFVSPFISVFFPVGGICDSRASAIGKLAMQGRHAPTCRQHKLPTLFFLASHEHWKLYLFT